MPFSIPAPTRTPNVFSPAVRGQEQQQKESSPSPPRWYHTKHTMPFSIPAPTRTPNVFSPAVRGQEQQQKESSPCTLPLQHAPAVSTTRTSEAAPTCTAPIALVTSSPRHQGCALKLGSSLCCSAITPSSSNYCNT